MCYIYSLELFNYLLSFADILIIKFSSVTQSCLTLCDPMDCSTPGFLVRHQHLELAQTYVHYGEGNGNPLQYSCLANPMDGEA